MCCFLLQIQGKISKLSKKPLHSVPMVRINSYINSFEQVHSKSKFITKYIYIDNSMDFEVTGRTKM